MRAGCFVGAAAQTEAIEVVRRFLGSFDVRFDAVRFAGDEVLLPSPTLNPSTSPKWASRETRIKPCCKASAAIQMSFSGIGLPARRKSFLMRA